LAAKLANGTYDGIGRALINTYMGDAKTEEKTLVRELGNQLAESGF